MHFKVPIRVVFFFVLWCNTLRIFSQIAAEAQGGKASMWFALGLDQHLSKKWMSVTDLGYGRHSDPNNYDVAKRLGLNVITQDFILTPATKWQFSFSLGYWKRNFYTDDAPYDMRPTPYQFRNEVRPYQKISYRQNLNNIKISHTLRTDYRFYFNQNFTSSWTTPFEFRLRFLESWKIPFTESQKNWLIINDEVLTAIDRKASYTTNWSSYRFTENRLSVYYRRTLANHRIELDFGIMDQYWREKPSSNKFNTSYNLMFDIIIKDPFAREKAK